MTLSEYVALHNSKTRTNCVYKKSKGRLGTCFINPEHKPTFCVSPDGASRLVESYSDMIDGKMYFRFTKHGTFAWLYLKLEDVEIASPKKAKVSKVLYGT